MTKSGLNYEGLKKSDKRKETAEDHAFLEEIMGERWTEIRDSCKRPYEDIEKWQFKRVKELVTHAYETVPLYEEKYSAEGFEPEDLQTWNDFKALPILTKEELISAFPDKCMSSKHNFEFMTTSSGSSGKFVTVVVSRNAVYEDTLQGIRQFDFQSGGKYHPEDKALFIYTTPWWITSVNGKYSTEFLSTTAKPEDAIKVIAEVKPKVLSTYPTYLRNLASIGADLKGSGVELVIIHSEQSTLREREALGEYFGVPVLDEFSSEELTRIALECPMHKYHLEEDACYVEIVDPKNPKTEQTPGKMGLVLGTNLLNEATPIIRYHQGDLAILNETQKCSCGSNFRILSSPKGRIMDSIRIDSDGTSVPASSFMDLAYNWCLSFDIPAHGMRYQI
ncbi:MAG: hypothetical protein KKE71_01080, partial [Nanoarchaeota archaeon]|nr:hypothetical protein [Nanoarchaeota archaeon]